MVDNLLFWLLPIVCWLLPSYTIGRKATRVYNRRYTILPNVVAKWFGLDAIYIHHFQASDPTTHLHNHPYTWGWSVILAGGYAEERRESFGTGLHFYSFLFHNVFWPGRRNTLTPDVYHRIDLLDPKRGCWTLFVAGKKHKRGWGFLDVETGIFTPWSGKNPVAVYEVQS